jgi:hypothetical protein
MRGYAAAIKAAQPPRVSESAAAVVCVSARLAARAAEGTRPNRRYAVGASGELERPT